MKCMSCQVEINPQWKHAIDINVCPFCGKEIMEAELKNLFTTLRTTMESLSVYPEQLDDWMISNHNYIKTDSKKLSIYMPKKSRFAGEENESDGEEYIVNVQTENGEQPVVAKKIQSNERTNSFFERAEAVKTGIDGFRNTVEKNSHIKNMLKQIKENGASSLDSSGKSSILSSEMMENADPDEVAKLQSLIDGGSIASSLPDMGSGDDDEVPSIVTAMANKAKGRSNNDAKDLISLQKIVEKAQGKGGGGSFSRSGS